MEIPQTIIEIGNLNEVNIKKPEREGWVVGSFVNDSILRNSKICEIKWERYKKGILKSSNEDLTKKFRTLVILVSGKWKVNTDEQNRNYVLKDPGDYIVLNHVKHSSESLEDSQIIAIRWQEMH